VVAAAMLSAGISLKRLISPSVRIACPRSIARETSETRVGQPRCPMLLLRCGPLIESEGTSMPSIRIIVAFATLVIAITPARAQEWPTRPVTMVVPFAAGGPLDVVGRLLASRLSQILDQQVVVENVTGAGGTIGSNRVAKAAPDGYQFVFGHLGTHAFSQTLYKKPLYDGVTDFEPVVIVNHGIFLLLVRKELPVSTLAEFIAYAKVNQKKMQFGSAGGGSINQMACVLLTIAMGTNITQVPYRGNALALQDLIGGRIDFMCDSLVTALPQIQQNTVKAIANLTPSRASRLPNLATAREQGLTEVAIDGWNAFFFPKGTPEPIVRRLNQATSEALDTPSVRERMQDLGTRVSAPEHRSPEYLAKLLRSDIERWADRIKAAGIAGQ
jgi:tripartite-type tricarboxylate transporter receptor subunit TctC